MLAVVIDTSSAAVTAGVVRVGRGGDGSVGTQLLGERCTVDAKAHGDLLTPSIGSALAAAGAGVGDIDAIVAGAGPGPFTVLRVGLVTAAALADALGRPAYGVCSLDAIGAATHGRALVAGDARRRGIYWATYADGRRVCGPDVARPADVAERIPTLAVTSMAGAGAVLYRNVLGLPPTGPDHPPVRQLGALAAARMAARAPAETLVPMYLRRPDATPPARPVAASAPGRDHPGAR
ncbi:MAG: tRNA (adenosine(37)-N6)-threonylcarbamoyltransferase complex dimerization subunit type 1 TsaB [Mycobacteriales bacterium]